MTRASEPSRRALLAVAVAAATIGTAGTVAAATSAGAAHGHAGPGLVDNRAWTSYADWRTGTAKGTRALDAARPGLVIATPAGTADYTDPHTGKTATWEYGTWTSPVHRLAVPATEVIASWNAHTPAGTWLQVELTGTYSDGKATPWYVMGRWASGDQDIRRTSVDDQTDGRSTIWTDTFSIDDAAS